MRASIVIPVRDGLAITSCCLESIADHTADVEVIVIDNGSGPEMREYLAQRCPTVIRNDRNRGWPMACNQGMAKATGEFVILLNNDTEVTPGWLDRLLAPFQDPRIGLTGPMSDNVSGPQNAGIRADWQIAASCLASAKAGKWRETDRLVGFCLAIRREVIDQIGGFDPRFGLGNFDDDDYSLRARISGWKLAIAEDCFVHHVGGATFAALGVDYQESVTTNRMRFQRKWAGLETPVTLDRLFCSLSDNQPRISLCMIVRNEERFLAGCLESAREAVDEICIVDTGSTDRTIKIAESFGARIERMEWPDDFSAARNRSLEMATGDWILVLDADERLESGRIDLQASVCQGGDGYLVHLISHDNVIHGLPRSFRNRPSIRYSGRIHEQPEMSGALCLESDVRISHLGYASDVVQDRDKFTRNLRLLRLECKERPNAPYAHFGLAALLLAMGNPGEAEESARHAIEVWRREPVVADYTAQLFIVLSNALSAQGKASEAFEAAREGALLTGNPEALFVAGTCLANNGQARDALPLFYAARSAVQQALEGQIVVSVLDPSLATWRTDVAIGHCLRCLNRAEAADEHFQRARESLTMTSAPRDISYPVYAGKEGPLPVACG